MKTISLLAVVFFALCLAVPAFAAGSISISSITIPSSVTQGDSFTITMSVSGSQATSVYGSLTLPDGLSCTEGTQSISLDADTGTGTASWSCTASVAGDYTSEITASVQALGSSSETLTDSEQTGLNVLSPASLAVSSTLSSSSVAVSGTATFTVGVNNAGDTSTNYNITLSWSPSGSGVSSSSTSVATNSIDGSSLENNAFTITGGSAGSYTITATIQSSNSQSLTTSKTLTVTGGGSGDNTPGGGSGPTTRRNDTAVQNETASRRPALVPGVGLRNNTHLQEAIAKVLSTANLSEQAMENLMRLSTSITSSIELTRNFSSSANRSTLTEKIKYNNSATNVANNFLIYDSIPKAFAQNTSVITVSAPGATYEIVEADPSYVFNYAEMSPGDEVTITYTTNKKVNSSVIDSFSTEAYAQLFVTPPAQVCTPATKRCSGSDLQQCIPTGTSWTTISPCSNGCNTSILACNQQAGQQPAGGTGNMIPIYAALIIAAAIAILAVLLFAKKKNKI
jgi:hypothetical protein